MAIKENKSVQRWILDRVGERVTKPVKVAPTPKQTSAEVVPVGVYDESVISVMCVNCQEHYRVETMVTTKDGRKLCRDCADNLKNNQ